MAHEYSNSAQDEQKIVGGGWESEFGGLDWTGLDWTTGMDYWNGMLEWNTGPGIGGVVACSLVMVPVSEI